MSRATHHRCHESLDQFHHPETLAASLFHFQSSSHSLGSSWQAVCLMNLAVSVGMRRLLAFAAISLKKASGSFRSVFRHQLFYVSLRMVLCSDHYQRHRGPSHFDALVSGYSRLLAFATSVDRSLSCSASSSKEASLLNLRLTRSIQLLHPSLLRCWCEEHVLHCSS